jgi:ribosome-binding ATPase YchF (GTP1/OBG family)
MEIVQTELILADLETTAKRTKKKGLNEKEKQLWDRIHNQLDEGRPARTLEFSFEETPYLKTLPLLTAKPIIYVCNIDAESVAEGTNSLAEGFKKQINEEYPGSMVYNVCASLESELI